MERDKNCLQFSLLQGALADSAFREPYWKNLFEKQNKIIKSKRRQEALAASALRDGCG